MTPTRLAAKVISRLFDPIIEIPVILMATASLAYLNGYRWRFLTLLFVLDALIPGLVFLLLWAKKKHFTDWDFHTRKERLPIFIVTVIMHAVGVMVAYLIERHPLAEILLAFWLLACVFLVITIFWKISIHAGVNSTLATLLFLLAGHQYWWVFLILPVVGWARIVDRDHSLSQIIVGSLIPPVLLTLLFYSFHVL